MGLLWPMYYEYPESPEAYLAKPTGELVISEEVRT